MPIVAMPYWLLQATGLINTKVQSLHINLLHVCSVKVHLASSVEILINRNNENIDHY